jgi:protein TonB
MGAALTLLIEALLLLILLTLSTFKQPGLKDAHTTAITLDTREVSQEPPEAHRSESQRQRQDQRTTQVPVQEQPQPAQAAQPTPAAPAPIIVPMQFQLQQAPVLAQNRPAAPARPLYGPPDVRSAASRDSQQVGTAPNGEPLYAAEWYQEPDDIAMRAYLSTARGPGWGLIACRTAPEYRVEDCVALDEYPQGSDISRSVLAAAWEFRVRPPRLGGRSLVGAWVRIRIDYDLVRH